MDWPASTLWWVVAGLLVAAELASGTFHLLLLALGAAAGAVAAHLGAAFSMQLVAAALVGSGATALWHFKRFRAPRSAPADATADAIRKIAAAIQQPGGEQAVQLKVAERAVEAYQNLARVNNTMIVPGNMSEVAALIGTAMTLMKGSSTKP